jgi:hypothetical protein
MIPTVGIDVWWQAHLIRPVAYAKFCMDNFGIAHYTIISIIN